MSDKPFDGAISAFYKNECPKDIRKAIKNRKKRQIINPDYPYPMRMDADEYDAAFFDLQVELIKMQTWAAETGQRIAVIFEGRDAAGKGGTIKRFQQHLNPRTARVVALSKPTPRERGQWYFQRYIQHLPDPGEIVFFDRSWYNRAVIEPVFEFCTDEQREAFFTQAPDIENMLLNDGMKVIKIWLTVGRAEQLRRFLSRESDPLKQWKLSGIDVKGLGLWDEYTDAITEMFARTHTDTSPWHVIRSDDKLRARIAAQRLVLSQLDYDGKNPDVVSLPDPQICSDPNLLRSVKG